MQSKNSVDGVELISARIPAQVMREIRILLLDPVTGRIKYAALSNLLTGLLTEWLEKYKLDQTTVSPITPPPDRFEVFDNEGD